MYLFYVQYLNFICLWVYLWLKYDLIVTDLQHTAKCMWTPEHQIVATKRSFYAEALRSLNDDNVICEK